MIRRTLIGAAVVLFTLAIPTAVSAQPYGAPGISTSAPLVPGATVTVTACCFVPGTQVVFSATRTDPGQPPVVVVADITATAGPDGVATLNATVPADAQPGTVVVSASGTPLSGYEPAPAAPLPIVSAPLETTTTLVEPPPTTVAAVAAEAIEGASGATTGQLPVTGSELARPLSLVALVLLAGGAAVLVVRRRHVTDNG
jgi:LPXTG-motif cell wall-anchored protein